MKSTLPLFALLSLSGIDSPPWQIFRSGTEAVYVDVLVTEGRRPISGLTAADFELRDAGVLQRIEAVAMDDIPVSLLLALDTSTSVRGKTIHRLKTAAVNAVTSLRPTDRAALLTFSSRVILASPWGTSTGAIAAALDSTRSEGKTSLQDAAFSSLVLRDDRPGHRNMLVLFSDGHDTASWLPEHAVIEKALRTDVVIFAVVMTDTGLPDRPQPRLEYRSGISLTNEKSSDHDPTTPFLTKLVEATGGTRFGAHGADDLPSTFTRIVTEFRSRYVLTYVPTDVEAKGWHPIDVRVKGRSVTVRARHGYVR